jgi:sarcosine oxidase
MCSVAQEEGLGLIVVGLGGIGAATAFQLASRGERVLGFDAHQPGHKLGSSHGRTRVVRQAYFEGLEYVTLARRAWHLWARLEEQSDCALLNRAGFLVMGPQDVGGETVARSAEAALVNDLPHDDLDGEGITSRFPALHVPASWRGILEHEAGFVDPELAIRVQLQLAAERGADLRYGERVMSFEREGEGVTVRTDRGRYLADRLVLAVGPWAPGMLASLGLPIQATRKVVVHFEPDSAERFSPEGLPPFFFALEDREVYGLPFLPGWGVKVARHDGGEVCTPETARREVDEAEVDDLRSVLDAYLPGSAGPVLDSYTCLYTMSGDSDFIVDAHPELAVCWFATGCSGHAFKFTPALGEALADRVTGAEPKTDIDFLSAKRFPVS